MPPVLFAVAPGGPRLRKDGCPNSVVPERPPARAIPVAGARLEVCLGFQATGNGGEEPREQVDFGFVVHQKEVSEVVRTGALVPLPPHYQLMTCISMAVLGIFDNWVRL